MIEIEDRARLRIKATKKTATQKKAIITKKKGDVKISS